MKMFIQIVDKLGLGNFGIFLVSFLNSKFNLIQFTNFVQDATDSTFVDKYLDTMFIISSTCAAIWGVLKLVDWVLKKIKK